MYAIMHGGTYVYEFEILNRAGTYWYHSHTHHVTGKQVYLGLAGLFIVSDEEEASRTQSATIWMSPVCSAVVIQDRSFDDQNQLVYLTRMRQRMRGFLGEQIFVNGEPDFELPVETRAYRLRLLNGSSELEYFQPIRVGDTITVVGRLARVKQTAGPRVFLVTEVTWTNQRGELAVKGKNTYIRY